MDPPVRRQRRPDHLVIVEADGIEGHVRHVVGQPESPGDVADAQRTGVVHQVTRQIRTQQLDVALDREVGPVEQRAPVERRALGIRNADARRAGDQHRPLDERRHGMDGARIDSQRRVLLLEFDVIRNAIVVRVLPVVDANAHGRPRRAQGAVRRRCSVVVPVSAGQFRPLRARADIRAVRPPVVLVRARFIARAVDERAVRGAQAVLAEIFFRIRQVVAVGVTVEAVRPGRAPRIQVEVDFPAVRQQVLVRVAIGRVRPFLRPERGQIARDRGRVGRAKQQRREERAHTIGVRRRQAVRSVRPQIERSAFAELGQQTLLAVAGQAVLIRVGAGQRGFHRVIRTAGNDHGDAGDRSGGRSVGRVNGHRRVVPRGLEAVHEAVAVGVHIQRIDGVAADLVARRNARGFRHVLRQPRQAIDAVVFLHVHETVAVEVAHGVVRARVQAHAAQVAVVLPLVVHAIRIGVVIQRVDRRQIRVDDGGCEFSHVVQPVAIRIPFSRLVEISEPHDLPRVQQAVGIRVRRGVLNVDPRENRGRVGNQVDHFIRRTDPRRHLPVPHGDQA